MKRQAVLSLSPSVNALLHFFVFTVKACRESVHSQSLFTICFSCAPIPNMHPGRKKSSSWGSSGGAHLPQKRRKENKKERWPANAQQTLPPRTDAERRQSLFSQRSRQLRLTKPFSPLKINGASSSPLSMAARPHKGKAITATPLHSYSCIPSVPLRKQQKRPTATRQHFYGTKTEVGITCTSVKSIVLINTSCTVLFCSAHSRFVQHIQVSFMLL